MNNEISATEVTDRESFIRFLGSIRNGFERGNTDWSNITLKDFLESLENYTNDVQGYYDNIYPGINADVPSWRIFADILKGASMYE